MPRTLTFGSQDFAFEGLPHDLFVVGLDGVQDALIEAIRYRRRGEPFDVFPVIEDPRAAFAWTIGSTLPRYIVDHDELRAAYDRLAGGNLVVKGHAQSTLRVQDPAAIETLGIICRLAERVVVRSRAEHDRVNTLLERRLGSVVSATPMHNVPMFAPRHNARGIVVWSPQQPRIRLGMILAAVRSLRFAFTVVCSDPTNDDAVRFVGLEEAQGVLRDARLVIDADISGPENAIAFAERGVALAVASTSGAEEFIDYAAVYDPWDRRSIVGAVQTGLAQTPAIRSHQEWSTGSPAGVHEHPAQQNVPLVSIIIRTKDRPHFLPRALASAAAQTYPNIEIVVVNDGGCDVGPIVAQTPNARLIVHASTRGMEAAANSGVQASRGTYFGLLDDDDVLFPDHVETLVAAIERSNAEIVHSDVLTIYLQMASDGGYAMRGAKLFLDRAQLPSDLYHTCVVSVLSGLFRRSAFDRIGGFPEDMAIMGDWETFLRLSRRGDIVHVPRVTALYMVRDDGSNATAGRADAFASCFSVIQQRHPIEARPALRQLQQKVLAARVAQGRPRWPAPAMTFVHAVPLELL